MKKAHSKTMEHRTNFDSFVLIALMLASTPVLASGLALVINLIGRFREPTGRDRMVELRRVPMLREPHHMALSPDGKYLLIGNTTGNELVFLATSAQN
ncbi:YncE family protein [Acidisoma sp. S159]|uniref:YncE family protein n=1 Tax=Acidisoma sp. S159 TaxID=1747225 RepID=UPI001C2021C4|nr:hypothetical protein [Acidisoma sp. S159]